MENQRFCNNCGDLTEIILVNSITGESQEINLCKYCLFRGTIVMGQTVLDNPEKEAQIKKFNDDRLKHTLSLDEDNEAP